MDSIELYDELRTIYINLENAMRAEDWRKVDRAIQRISELNLKIKDMKLVRNTQLG